MTPLHRPRRAALLVLALLLAAGAPGCTPFKRWAYSAGDRDAWQQPDRVVEALAIEPGARVVDLGSGGGYFTFRLADAAGPTGRVLAVDVDAGMQDALREDLAERGTTNVDVVLAEPGDPKLAPGSVDLVFTSNTYHHIEDRVAYFRLVRGALAARGRVAVVEYREGEGGLFGGHATATDRILAEMAEAGFELAESHDFLERQSFQVFRPAGGH